jgi:hypothetical protein
MSRRTSAPRNGLSLAEAPPALARHLFKLPMRHNFHRLHSTAPRRAKGMAVVVEFRLIRLTLLHMSSQ